MRWMFLYAIAILMAAGTVQAQSDRIEQINRVTEGLNSPNPAIRIVTLEEAMRSGDRTLRQFALQQALGSSDLTLRSTALSLHLEQDPTMLVEIVSVAMPENSRAYDRAVDWAQGVAGAVDISIRGFDPQTGGFETFSSHSRVDPREGIATQTGNLSGDRLSFQVDVARSFGGSGECIGFLRLEGEGAIMQGE
ncbi:MAG: hypothetical protein LAT81_03290, partial [Oceanicaulis sp.]|nr:hypothetical protein [Oceanicaulis sp.]